MQLHNYCLETVSMTNEVSKQQTVGSLACHKTMHVGLGAVLITAYLHCAKFLHETASE